MCGRGKPGSDAIRGRELKWRFRRGRRFASNPARNCRRSNRTVSEPGLTGRIENDSSNSHHEPRLWPGQLEYLPKTIAGFATARRWWLHGALFVLTLITTTVFGFAQVQSFRANRPLEIDWIVDGYMRLAHGDLSVLSGLNFSIPLMVILLAHEFGHYIACQRWRVDASLPYFLPSPTLFGTLGAFIRIRSPIYTRKALFDIGVSGPIAGFVVLIPFLIGGVLVSRVTPVIPHTQQISLGTPLALRLIELFRFPGVPASHISLHPVAVAAW